MESKPPANRPSSRLMADAQGRPSDALAREAVERPLNSDEWFSENARNSVERQRPSESIGYYATAADLATGCSGAALTIAARSAGTCLTPMTLRN